jgi:hypothetical protein
VDFKDRIADHVKRVRELHEHVRGNEQATKMSLVVPLFKALGYDFFDPRECKPEYKVDFGRDRSVKPIDWAVFINGKISFVVEAKEVGKQLKGYSEQLGDYFAKEPLVNLGILTNGVTWRFYTDTTHAHIMDKEPFLVWNVLEEDTLPMEFLTVLQKNEFNPQLIKTFAKRTVDQNLLIQQLDRLFEPSNEVIRLAIQHIESRKLTENVLSEWRPILKNAISTWIRERMLDMVITRQEQEVVEKQPRAQAVVTTQQEIDTYNYVQSVLGPGRPVEYTDCATYFKIHLPSRPRRVLFRIRLEGRKPKIWSPVPISQVESVLSDYRVDFPTAGWIGISLTGPDDVKRLDRFYELAYAYANNSAEDDGVSIEAEES